MTFERGQRVAVDLGFKRNVPATYIGPSIVLPGNEAVRLQEGAGAYLAGEYVHLPLRNISEYPIAEL